MSSEQIIDRFNEIIETIVSLFASKQFAFIYCLMGTFVQVTHTFYLSSKIASYDQHSFFGAFQVFCLSAFISSSLLFFILIADTEDKSKLMKNNFIAINVFMIIEILINIYYYTKHLIIEPKEMRVFDFFFGVVIGVLIPVTLKLYAGHIKLKIRTKKDKKINIVPDIDIRAEFELVHELYRNLAKELTSYSNLYSQNKEDIINIKEKLNEILDASVSKSDDKTINMDEISEKIDNLLTTSFDKNSKAFIEQFQNKATLIVNQKLKEIKGN